jgi:hypothetical protein
MKNELQSILLGGIVAFSHPAMAVAAWTTYTCYPLQGKSTGPLKVFVDRVDRMVRSTLTPGFFTCNQTLSDGITGPVTDITCDVPGMQSLVVRQRVTFNGNEVTFGGTVLKGPLGLFESQTFWTQMNLRTGFAKDSDSGEYRCRTSPSTITSPLSPQEENQGQRVAAEKQQCEILGSCMNRCSSQRFSGDCTNACWDGAVARWNQAFSQQNANTHYIGRECERLTGLGDEIGLTECQKQQKSQKECGESCFRPGYYRDDPQGHQNCLLSCEREYPSPACD